MSSAPVEQEHSSSQQNSEEGYRALFLQEQSRARHLSLINEVQKCALATRESQPFLQQVTRAIQSHFSDCDATFYLCEKTRAPSSGFSDNHFPSRASSTLPFTHSEPNLANEACGDLIVAACAGAHGFAPPTGSWHAEATGLPGQVAQCRRTLHYSDITQNEAEEVRAGMCVPVISGGRLLGVVCLQSRREDAVQPRDAVALQTAAAIIASHLESGRLFDEMRELSAFNETLITTMLHSLMAVDQSGIITLVNARLCQTLGLSREELLHQPVERVFGEGGAGALGSVSLSNDAHPHSLREAIREVAETGTPHELPEVQVRSPDGIQVFDVRLFRVYFRGEAQAVLLLINLTRRWRMFRQLQLMNEVGRLFNASLDVRTVLHTVLTCITAGSGLGFNRAFLLLRDGEGGGTQDGRTRVGSPPILHGAMALGPSSHEEASRIWREMAGQNLSLAQMLALSDPLDRQNLTPLQERALALEIDLSDSAFPAIARALHERRALCVRREELIDNGQEGGSDECHSQREAAWELFTSPEIAVAPLLDQDRVVGVVLADNLYSGAMIEPDDIQLLDALAQQAGLTIANALAYRELQNAQQELVTAERLAAVGEMAARVSHEIRNPLATVGGFARNISKNPSDAESVARKTQIIVGEVARLEELLTDLLDLARPRVLCLEAHNLNAVVEHAILLADADIAAMNVVVEKSFDDTLPAVQVDRSRILQALLNIVRNGAQAMPEGGVLRITTRRSPDEKWAQVEVRDGGVGMSDNALKHVFDPFFSTKLKGSGLGLAITRRIIEEHDGDIDVFSELGQGTTFVLSFPLRRS